MRIMVLSKLAAAASAALTLNVAVAAQGAPAQPRGSVITCANTASGSTWRIAIDFDHSTVDSYPATISGTEISWHDAKDGGNYTLDRKTGELTFVAPSSTGGYFLHHQCRLPR
jgi:hypothetical protein